MFGLLGLESKLPKGRYIGIIQGSIIGVMKGILGV